MTYDDVKAYLEALGLKPIRFGVSSATVALAAQAVGCEPCRIAKTISFMVDGKPVLVVLAGDTRVDNPKFKACFNHKAVMLAPDKVAELTGFPVGGYARSSCPKAYRFSSMWGLSASTAYTLRREAATARLR